MNMLNKSWILYNTLFLAVITLLVGGEYCNTFIFDRGESNLMHVVVASWLFVFHVLVFFPVWLIVLWFKRKSITLKAFFIGFGLLLLSAIPGISGIVWIIGSAGSQT